MPLLSHRYGKRPGQRRAAPAATHGASSNTPPSAAVKSSTGIAFTASGTASRARSADY